MVKLLLAALIPMGSAGFHHWGLGATGCHLASHLRAIAMFVMSQTFLFLGKPVWCKWIFSLRVMQVLYWLVLDWMGWRYYDWKHKNLTEQWIFAAVWLLNWAQTPRIFKWFCLMGVCLVQSPKQIHLQHFLMWFQSEPKWQAYCSIRRAKGVRKWMCWNSIPMLSHRFRKVCMDMTCGRLMVALPTAHHPYLGAPVEYVVTWENFSGPSNSRFWKRSLPGKIKWQSCMSMLPPSELK